jgi:endonuclease-3 related protein
MIGLEYDAKDVGAFHEQRSLVRHVVRIENYTDIRVSFPDSACQLDSVALRLSEPQVQDDYIDCQAANGLQGVCGSRGPIHDLQVRVLPKDRRYPCASEGVIVDHEDTRWTRSLRGARCFPRSCRTHLPYSVDHQIIRLFRGPHTECTRIRTLGRYMPKRPGPLLEVHDRLLAAHGPQQWWPASSPFEVIVGAVLTQNTTWLNATRAIDNLKSAGKLTAAALRETPAGELAELLRPAGYFNAKARKLQAVAEYLGKYGDDLNRLFRSKPLPELRREWLGVHGVGPETADAILLYAGGLPTFVVDAYTVRLLGRLGWIAPTSSYQDVQGLFHSALASQVALFNEFHALLVAHGKHVCRKSEPLCERCPLLDLCEAGRRRTTDASTIRGVSPPTRPSRRQPLRPATAAQRPSPARRGS